MNLCNKCKFELAKINGRTLKSAMDIIKPSDIFGKFSLTEWVNICPQCNAYALGAELVHPFPFMCNDGVMRTVADIDLHPNKYKKSNELDFAGFNFSKSSLESAIAHIKYEDGMTRNIEKFGSEIDENISQDKLLEFSRQVCEWGRGQRVWGNLNRHHNPIDLATAYSKWFRTVKNNNPTDEEAIFLGIDIKGLGISFASKHLRMLVPEKYAVLDEVLSEGLGFALNIKGYKLFMNLMRSFSNNYNANHNAQYTVSEIESGIFFLVRQQVRST